jgi:hypothetical protein
MKLYTVIVHNLQMCMKEYRCCLKFRTGDNSTYTFTKRGVVYLVSATPTKLLIEFFMKLYTVYCILSMKNFYCHLYEKVNIGIDKWKTPVLKIDLK